MLPHIEGYRLLRVVATVQGDWVADFSLKSRHTGVENLLREFQRAHPGCLVVGGPCSCSEADLRSVRSRGCTAHNGVVDPS